MIILEELCRNNLVMSDTYGICIVTGIEGDSVKMNNGSYYVSEKFYELKPVDISGKILEVFGFHEAANTGNFINYSNDIKFYINRSLISNNVVKYNQWYVDDFVNIKYFHNLQNYYRIVTGDFLNIDIKKLK